MAVNDKASLNTMEWTGEDIVEYILLLCAGEFTFDDLMQLMTFSSPTLLKRYLFYLIDYDLVSYNGQKQVYLIKDKGLDLLCSLARKLKQY
ncbi:MAG TPA: hypothetical protein VI278_16250 [Nitrososphaeraceae archaeon]